MKFIDEYRNGESAKLLARKIQHAASPNRHYRLMEFCGGHTHSLFRYGITALLPDNVEMLHGPGCPVCVLPISKINAAIEIAETPDTILCSYGDMLRVPGSAQYSLLKAKARGADVRMVYSPSEALVLAQQNPDKRVVFFAVGFETTTPPTAAIMDAALAQSLDNFSVFCNHVLTPPALKGILNDAPEHERVDIDGIVGPGHVSVVTGTKLYQDIARDFQIPITIAGFEPLDIMQAILMLIEQVNRQDCSVNNEYLRAVTQAGNLKAQKLMNKYFELRDTFEWRGLGFMPQSALAIKAEFSHLDAEKQFALSKSQGHDNKACECPSVLIGQKKPTDCKLFNNPCTPDNPLGSCMVSSEGACAAYYNYKRFDSAEPLELKDAHAS